MAYVKRRRAAPKKRTYRPRRASTYTKSRRAAARRSYKPQAVEVRIVHETATGASRPVIPANLTVRRAKF